MRGPTLDVTGTTAGLIQDFEFLLRPLVSRADLARPYGLQNPYLPAARVQCGGSLYRTFCRLLVRGVCWPQGRGLWLRWFTPLLGYAPAYTQQLSANTWLIVMAL